MALTQSPITETKDALEVEYFDWDPADAPVSIHIHLDAVDGIARDVIEGLKTLPRRGLEVGGLLLGRVDRGDRREVWVERYQRMSCQHRFGPQFVLDEGDRGALEAAAGSILEGGELSVVGFYRSHTRAGFQLEEPDFDLVRRYFSEPSDLILLIRPESMIEISAQFFVAECDGTRPVGPPFPFHGRGISLGVISGTQGEEAVEVKEEINEIKEVKEIVEEPPPAYRVEAETVPRDRLRHLIPAFTPSPVEPEVAHPSPVVGLVGPDFMAPPTQSTPLQNDPGPRLLPFEPAQGFEAAATGTSSKKWLPLLAALLLVGGALWFVLQPARRDSLNAAISNTTSSEAPAAATEPARPLGLYVDSAGPFWRVTWNPNATALHDARRVQMFVREGDDQNRIDLSPRDLSSGSYQSRATGNDVTFRLEVADSSGRVSAESFRFTRTTNPAPVPPPPPKPAPPAEANNGPTAEPRVIHRAPPTVAAGIRPRIKDKIPIDVRVRVDTKGKVMAATAITKTHSGLEAYLATRAVSAARLWRYEPARQNGKPVQADQTIHFVFEK